jgi:hypothetical protein
MCIMTKAYPLQWNFHSALFCNHIMCCLLSCITIKVDAQMHNSHEQANLVTHTHTLVRSLHTKNGFEMLVQSVRQVSQRCLGRFFQMEDPAYRSQPTKKCVHNPNTLVLDTQDWSWTCKFLKIICNFANTH